MARGVSRSPAVGALGPRQLRPCARPTLADRVLRLVVRALVKRRAGQGAHGQGRPALTGGAQGRARGEGPVFAVMARVGSCALGEGGFRCHQVYYWGGIMCPLVRCVLR